MKNEKIKMKNGRLRQRLCSLLPVLCSLLIVFCATDKGAAANTVPTESTVSNNMVLIEGGTFLMGTAEEDVSYYRRSVLLG